MSYDSINTELKYDSVYTYDYIVRYSYAVNSFNRSFHNSPELTYISKSGYVTHPQEEAICLSKTTNRDGTVLIQIIIRNTFCRRKECYLCVNQRGWIVGKKNNDYYDYYAQSSGRLFHSNGNNYSDNFDIFFLDSLEKYMKLDVSRDECQFMICKNTEIWINDDLFNDLYKIIKNGRKIDNKGSTVESAGDSTLDG